MEIFCSFYYWQVVVISSQALGIKEKVRSSGLNWSKSGLVRKETPEYVWCNLRLKSEFYESLGISRYA